MGRVSKYKKIKACDPYSKKNGGNVDLSTVGIWGLGDNGRKKKRKSRTAERLKAQKGKKHKKNKNNDDGDGFDLPPSEADEFDLMDLMGSVKKQELKTKELLGRRSSSNSDIQSCDEFVTWNSFRGRILQPSRHLVLQCGEYSQDRSRRNQGD